MICSADLDSALLWSHYDLFAFKTINPSTTFTIMPIGFLFISFGFYCPLVLSVTGLSIETIPITEGKEILEQIIS